MKNINLQHIVKMFAVIVISLSSIIDLKMASAQILHVENYGEDSSICGTKIDPCRSISHGISNANEGDKILVGPGFYGDINGNGILGETGEENGEINSGCNCMLKVNKKVTIISTDGPQTTMIDASIGKYYTEGSPVVAVQIAASGVVFGKVEHGFTLTLSLRNSGLAILGPNTSGVIVEGNISSRNGRGFSIFGTKNIIRNNIALGNSGPGFDLAGSDNILKRNFAIGGGEGFFVFRGTGHILSDNVATGNLIGYTLWAGVDSFTHNSSIGNKQAGIRLNKNISIVDSNIYGNGDQGGDDIIPQINCGLVNASGQHINATNNYWGAAYGPGENPADDICDENGTTEFEPFADKPFKVLFPFKKENHHEYHRNYRN